MNIDKKNDLFDVIVVGLGPVGATLSNLLGKCGVRVLVLDREASAYHLPRAVHFDDEVMRVFQTINVGDAIAKTLRINPGMKFVDEKGSLLLDWPRPQEISSQGWNASYRFHQPDIEVILRSALEQYPHVTVRTCCEVLTIEDHNGVANLTYKDLQTSEVHQVSAKYVVGCDGGRSLVRGIMGVGMEDFGFNERWLVVDVLLKKEKPELGDYTIQYCNPGRPATYARGPGIRRRWEITIKNNEASEEVIKDEAVWKFLKPWINQSDANLERAAVYTFNSAVVKEWRKGRLLVAGDAAHLTPPFMGQGMCAGIRDVSNLAWKLALCVQGNASETLLDSYGIERYPHAKEYILTAVRLGRLINTCGTEEALKTALQPSNSSARMTSISPSLGKVLAAGDALPAGRLFPQPKMSNDSLSDDLNGYRFVLFIDQSIISLSDSQRNLLTHRSIQIVDTSQSNDLKGYLSDFDAKAILVRPDRYILGRANSLTQLQLLVEQSISSPPQWIKETP